MIYEFIATISAGFAMAGIALIIRHLSKFAGFIAPKWLIPVFAGAGMLGFQIYQEYHWQEQQINRLPEEVTVVKQVEGKEWFRPWSYVKPQVVRFMAVNAGTDISSQFADLPEMKNDTIKQVNIYLFERRMSNKQVPQLINCTQPAHADMIGAKQVAADNTTQADDTTPTEEQAIEPVNIQKTIISKEALTWVDFDTNDDLYQAVCQS